MSDQIRYEAVHREGLRVVVRLVQEAVWAMEGPEDWQQVLGTLVDGFKSLRVPLNSCGIHLVDASTVPAAIPCQYIFRDDRWRQSVAGSDRDVITLLWNRGASTYREDLDAQDIHVQQDCLSRRFGYKVASSLDLPFAGGILSLYSSKAKAFSDRDLEIVKELAEELPAVFHRMDDLKQFESKEWQLERAQRLEMVGQLTTGMAHEINNSLTVIAGQCELLMLDNLSPDVKESIELMAKASESTHTIVKGLLNLARGQEAEKRLADINTIVTDSLRFIHKQFKRDNVELIEDLGSDLPQIRCQTGQIQQVLLNLAQNSRDALLANKNGGTIRVRTSLRAGRVSLEVSDDGPGIPETVRHRIFEAFFTTKERGKGTGLGLSVCQTIATGHKGYLYADPRDAGACIVLDLPAADEAAFHAASG